MRQARKVGAGTLVLVVGLVGLGLLACKKSGGDATPTATAPTSAPPATVAPETTASSEPAATASAAPEATTTDKMPIKPTVKTDAGVKDAGVADAAADAAPPPNTAADVKAIEACCGALNAEAKKPGTNQNKYKSAASVCSGIAAQVKKGTANAAAAKTLIRAQLQGVPVPGSC